MQIKMAPRLNLAPVRRAKMKTQVTVHAGEDME